ncbi:RNA-binding protein, putative [Trypanosoma cruzi marinkellei]|uniref:RNA-binding protein, putative n=1 Tax=Trypanosoma cruzi marinkellei TaxID=85056 RepID=K2LUN5_TRYCR|nr:RNA-binding protein, putative [Trypanosoma cruzi marinkellei]
MGLKSKNSATKAFTEAAADAARTAVETITVRTAGKTPHRRVSFEAPDVTRKKSSGESKAVKNTKNFAAAAKRAIVGGIIEARKRPREEKEEEEGDDNDDETAAHDVHDDEEEEESDVDSVDSDSDNEENLSELADSENTSEASQEEEWENPFEKSKREGTRLSYEALRLRFLPPEFQEPQLFKFLSQFGAKVLNCFCVRSRRTHQSKGIAYVQFDSPAVLPTVVEECHGMSLGGRAVQASVVTLHRAMPSKEKIAQRRQLAYVYKTRGTPLHHHDIRKKNPIAALIKYTRVEKANNEHLKRLGIDYMYHGFEEQLKKIPSHLIIRKKKRVRKAHRNDKDATDKKITWN